MLGTNIQLRHKRMYKISQKKKKLNTIQYILWDFSQRNGVCSVGFHSNENTIQYILWDLIETVC